MQDKKYYAYVALHHSLANLDLYVMVSDVLIRAGVFSHISSAEDADGLVHRRRAIEDADLFMLIFSSSRLEQTIPQAFFDYVYARSLLKPVMIFDVGGKALEGVWKARGTANKIYHNLHSEAGFIELDSLGQLVLAFPQQLATIMTKSNLAGWVRPESNVYKWATERNDLLDQIDKLKQRLDHAVNAELVADDVITANTVIHFSAHLYMHGNFKPVELSLIMTWEELLIELGPSFEDRTSEESFRKILTRYISERAIDLARKEFPDTHAVTRIQIRLKDLFLVKYILKKMDWILPVSQDEQGRLLWQLTAKGSEKITALLQKDQNALLQNTQSGSA